MGVEVEGSPRREIVGRIAGAELDPGPLGEEEQLGLQQAATGFGLAHRNPALRRYLAATARASETSACSSALTNRPLCTTIRPSTTT